MDFLSVKSWSQEEPAYTNSGCVLVSLVYSGAMLMDGSRDESVSVRVRDQTTGEQMLLDGVHRRSIQEQALDMLNEGANRDDVWEFVVAQVVRTLNRGLYIQTETTSDGEGIEW